jgi:hypothetical protein
MLFVTIWAGHYGQELPPTAQQVWSIMITNNHQDNLIKIDDCVQQPIIK